MGTSINPPKEYMVKTPDTRQAWEHYQDDDELPRRMYSQEEIVDHNNNTLCQQPAYDKMINAEATLQCGENIEQSMVIRRSMGPNGKTTGGYDDNYRLNSVLYDVEFPDGQVKEYSANLISENLLGRVGYEFTSNIMEAIVYHTQDAKMAIPFKNKNVVAGSGKKPRKTLIGWKIKVRWVNREEQWIPLDILKESHPVEVSEYATTR